MAVITPTAGSEVLALRSIVWSGLGDGDVGVGAEVCAHRDWTVQAVGTFGSQGEVTIEGSNDGVTFRTFFMARQTSEVVLSDEDVVRILSAPRFVRPRVTGGNASTDLTVTLVGRR